MQEEEVGMIEKCCLVGRVGSLMEWQWNVDVGRYRCLVSLLEPTKIGFYPVLLSEIQLSLSALK